MIFQDHGMLFGVLKAPFGLFSFSSFICQIPQHPAYCFFQNHWARFCYLFWVREILLLRALKIREKNTISQYRETLFWPAIALNRRHRFQTFLMIMGHITEMCHLTRMPDSHISSCSPLGFSSASLHESKRLVLGVSFS